MDAVGHLLKPKTSKRGARLPYRYRFRDQHGKWRELALSPNKRASEDLARRIDDLIELRKAGSVLTADLVRWLQNSTDLRLRLEKFGVIDTTQSAGIRSLDDHIDDWEDQLLTSRGRKYAQARAQRVRVFFNKARFIEWRDINVHKAVMTVSAMRSDRTMSDTTVNYHLAAAKGFCAWMYHEGRAKENPLITAKGISRPIKVADRRALTDAEVGKLLKAAESSRKSLRFNTGPERALIYRFALETGMRADEIGCLTRDHFDFRGDRPCVKLRDQDVKNGRGRTVPLRPDLVADVKAYIRQRLQEESAGAMTIGPAVAALRVFKFSDQHSSEFFEFDRAAAKIRKRDDAGRKVDFHALRHTCGSNLARSGAHPSVVMELLGQSDVRLTMKFYVHTVREDLDAAIDRLPDLSNLRSESHAESHVSA